MKTPSTKPGRPVWETTGRIIATILSMLVLSFFLWVMKVVINSPLQTEAITFIVVIDIIVMLVLAVTFAVVISKPNIPKP